MKDFDIDKFKLWEEKCNTYMLRFYGVGIDDLPDMEWDYWYKDNIGPRAAAKKAIDKVNREG